MLPFINRLRGALAILVAAGHIAAVCILLPTHPDSVQTALKPVLMVSGFNFVIGFIVVSGYCIARSTGQRPFNLVDYAILCVTRIYPALVACGLLAAFIELCLFKSSNRFPMWVGGIDVTHLAWNLLGFTGFKGNFGSYAPTYTISYELFYYLVWGCLLALVPQRLGYLAMVAIMPTLLFILPSLQFPIVLSALWLMGAGLATYESSIPHIFKKFPLWLMWMICVTLFFLGNNKFDSSQISLWQFPGSLCAIPCGLLFALVIASHLVRSGPSMLLDEWLGQISYPLFLAHGPVIIAIGSIAKAMEFTPQFGSFFLILFASAIAVAQAIVIFVERPVMSWRRRRLRGKRLLPAHPSFLSDRISIADTMSPANSSPSEVSSEAVPPFN